MTDFDAAAATWDDDPARRERVAAIADGVRGAVPVTRHTRVLEYGAGTGALGLALAPDVGSVTLADPSAGMVAVARERLASAGLDPGRAWRLDLLLDPPPEERFDLVVSAMALHHVPDVPRLLRILHALLAPGGWIALADLDAEDGRFHDDPTFHGHNGFDRDELAASAAAAGFGNTAFTTPHVIRKAAGDFPVFLLTARRH